MLVMNGEDCPYCNEVGSLRPAKGLLRRVIYGLAWKMPLQCKGCAHVVSVMHRPMLLSRIIDRILP